MSTPSSPSVVVLRGHETRVDGSAASGLVMVAAHRPGRSPEANTSTTAQRVELRLAGGRWECPVVLPGDGGPAYVEVTVLLDGAQPEWRLLGVTEGDATDVDGEGRPVVYVADLTPLGDPPVPPERYYTRAEIDDLLDANGLGGPPDGLTTTRIASTIMSGHRIVTPSSTGAVEYADNLIPAHRGRAMWMTLGAATSGALVTVCMAGLVNEPSWSWLPGPVFLGVNGQPTQTPPVAPAFLAVVGFATSPTALVVDRQPSVVLAP